VVFELARGTNKGWQSVATLEADADDDVAQLELKDLEADTTYSIVARQVDGDARSSVTRFRTAPPQGGSRVVRFGATSCMGGNFPWESLSRAGEEQLDCFLLLGDTIYNDWWSGTLDEKWAFALEQQGMRDLSASTSFIATWDDHEVRNNWNPSTQSVLAKDACKAFKRGIPQREGQGEYEIWRSLRWGNAVEFFVLDCRGERSDNQYLSDDQMEWFETALTDSPARFKVVLNSVPITDLSSFGSIGETMATDRWQGYPESRDRILQHIADSGIEGVLWVSGDFHVGAVSKVDASGGIAEDSWEVLTGPGGSPIDDLYSLVPETDRMPAVVTTHNYVLFRCNPDNGQVIVRFIADDGTELRRLALQL